jgi:hypothetical protein
VSEASPFLAPHGSRAPMCRYAEPDTVAEAKAVVFRAGPGAGDVAGDCLDIITGGF